MFFSIFFWIKIKIASKFMGQCFLKDCGFEFQKLPQNKGKPFPEFFKEVI